MPGGMARIWNIGIPSGIVLALLLGATNASAATSVANHVRVAIDSNPDFSKTSASAQRNSYVILTDSQVSKMQQLKAANPNLKVLLYKNLSASRADCTSSTSGCGTGVTYQQADSQHPEWFLQNKQGARIRFSDYADLWAMDVGSASYQAQWADNVINEVQRDGWDGVFLDDTNTTMKYHYSVSNIAKYPSDSSWQSATRSALAAIGPRIQAAGHLAIANIGSWHEYPAVGNSWLAYLNGGMLEHFAKWGYSAGSGYADQGTWQTMLNTAKYAQSQGKVFLGVSDSTNTDAAAARYGWATTLLAAQGTADFALHGDYTNEPTGSPSSTTRSASRPRLSRRTPTASTAASSAKASSSSTQPPGSGAQAWAAPTAAPG